MDAEINDLQALCDAKDSALYLAECEIDRLRDQLVIARTTQANLHEEIERLRDRERRITDQRNGLLKGLDQKDDDIARLRGLLREAVQIDEGNFREALTQTTQATDSWTGFFRRQRQTVAGTSRLETARKVAKLE